jgi:hypothetical protein
VDKDKIFDLFDNTLNTTEGGEVNKKKVPVHNVGSYYNLGMFTKLISKFTYLFSSFILKQSSE